MYFGVVTHLYQGLDAEENQRLGERIAFFQLASDGLGKLHKIKVSPETYDALQFTG